MAGLENLAEGAGKLLNVAPQAYDDLLKPAAQAAGQTLALSIQTVNAFLTPLRQWIANAEYKLEETNKLIANKLKYIDEQKLISPPEFVAVPALQALSYSMDSKILRDMYANLIAKSMVSDTTSDVHPAYVEIIKQFSPFDAKLYQYIISNFSEQFSVVLYNMRFNSGNKTVKKFNNVFDYQDASLSDIAQSVDNYIRCGFIAVTQYYIVEGVKSEDVVKWRNVQKELSVGVEMQLDMCTPTHITELGKKFYSVCCADFDNC